MVEFASKVMFRVAGKVQGGNMTERWYEGIWLGKTTLSDEHLIMKGDGLVVRARAVRIMGTTLSYEDIDKLRSAPHDPTGTMKQDASIPRGAVEPADLEAENAPPEPRRVRLTTDVVDKFGPSERCTKCRLIINGDGSHVSYGHSEDCRTRLEESMREDPEFAHRLTQQQDRTNRFIEQYMTKKLRVD